MDDLIIQHRTTWDEEVAHILFSFRGKVCAETGTSPFNMMFGRCPTGQFNDEEKENRVTVVKQENIPNKRRRLQSSMLEVGIGN